MFKREHSDWYGGSFRRRGSTSGNKEREGQNLNNPKHKNDVNEHEGTSYMDSYVLPAASLSWLGQSVRPVDDRYQAVERQVRNSGVDAIETNQNTGLTIRVQQYPCARMGLDERA